MILAGAADVLDFSQPVAVMLVAVLHMLRDEEDPGGIVTRLMSAVPPGSFSSSPTWPATCRPRQWPRCGAG